MFLLSIESFLIVGITAALSFAAFVVISLVIRRKSRGGSMNKSSRKGIAHIILLFILFFMIALVLSLTVGGDSFEGLTSDTRINLVPFIDIATNTSQYIQNMLLFVPLGLLLPLLWRMFEKPSRTVIAGALFSLSIEFMQLFSDRATDIDDLIMNTLGILLGWAVFTLLRRIAPQTMSRAREPQDACEPQGAREPQDARDPQGAREPQGFHQKREVLLCFALVWLAILFIYPLLLECFVSRIPPGVNVPLG